jgi:predicted metal-dependent hydrolase
MRADPGRIIRRRVNIDFAAADAGAWSRRNTGFEDALNALSFAFPAGEAYFINSVRNYLKRIKDPVLKEQAERFIYQEAMHSKEHDRANHELRQFHAYGRQIERLVVPLLAFSRRCIPKATQLATTCALEHFTAMLADCLLRDQQRFVADSDPSFVALWLWHAVEETEHKSVCFDVYQHICGKGAFSYLHRVIVMGSVSMLFLGVLGVSFMRMKWSRSATRKRRDGGQTATAPHSATPTLGFLLHDVPLRMYFDYYRPSFHPWRHDNAHLVDDWKAHFREFGVGGNPQ